MAKQPKGLERLGLGESSDDGVPREAIGLPHLGENLARVLQISAVGKRAETEDLGGGEGVVDLFGFDEVGVDLVEVSHGFA